MDAAGRFQLMIISRMPASSLDRDAEADAEQSHARSERCWQGLRAKTNKDGPSVGYRYNKNYCPLAVSLPQAGREVDATHARHVKSKAGKRSLSRATM